MIIIFPLLSYRQMNYFCKLMISEERNVIFAPITLIGESAVSLIRISGKGTFNIMSEILSRSFNRFENLSIDKLLPYSIHHCYIYDKGKNQAIDEVLISIFKSPNSYTGEDSVEISCHGGGYIFSNISSLLTKNGAHPAEPGEFSKRAFLNGKLDLAQAEAIAELIKARSEEARKLAFKQLTGEYSSRIEVLKKELINYCSLLELELDFTEEDIELVSREELVNKADELIMEFKKLSDSHVMAKMIKNGINLAIIGEPNVGKSSLFNYLLNQERAIVSNIPGTTRDYITETLNIEGQLVNLIDTAGIRKPSEQIEEEGIKRSISISKNADIVILLKDATSSELKSEPIENENYILAYNKCDLLNGKPNQEEVLLISAKTGRNIDRLLSAVARRIRKITGTPGNLDILVLTERHRNCLLKSCEYLEKAKKNIIEGKGNELISIDVREAINAMGEITGRITNVDILNNIFSKFCIGK